MLGLKTHEQARNDFEKSVTDKITSAQQECIQIVKFEYLPSFILNELRNEFHYPVEYRNNKYIVSVL